MSADSIATSVPAPIAMPTSAWVSAGASLPLPEVARAIVNEYLAKERPNAAAREPLFQVQYKWYGGEKKTRRMSGQRVWKIIKNLGKRVGVDTIHPHAFRHACGVELLKRSGGNLRAVQEHLRHADIQTMTIYTTKFLEGLDPEVALPVMRKDLDCQAREGAQPTP
jgi:site-specific recombinase XerD